MSANTVTLLACVLFLHIPPTFAADFTGKVVGVTDGDTLDVMHGKHAERVRLYGIDCPEKRQAFGTRSKQATSKLAYGEQVTVTSHGHDRYGRTIGDVTLPDNKNLNQELVQEGMCWWYRKYAPMDTTLERLEVEARTTKRGLWADLNPIPPWEWRATPHKRLGR